MRRSGTTRSHSHDVQDGLGDVRVDLRELGAELLDIHGEVLTRECQRCPSLQLGRLVWLALLTGVGPCWQVGQTDERDEMALDWMGFANDSDSPGRRS